MGVWLGLPILDLVMHSLGVGLHSCGLHFEGLHHSGGLHFGVLNLGQPILDLVLHSLVSKKQHGGPFNVFVVWGSLPRAM